MSIPADWLGAVKIAILGIYSTACVALFGVRSLSSYESITAYCWFARTSSAIGAIVAVIVIAVVAFFTCCFVGMAVTADWGCAIKIARFGIHATCVTFFKFACAWYFKHPVRIIVAAFGHSAVSCAIRVIVTIAGRRVSASVALFLPVCPWDSVKGIVKTVTASRDRAQSRAVACWRRHHAIVAQFSCCGIWIAIATFGKLAAEKGTGKVGIATS